MFEHLDDAGLRTACTTYLIYRGRHRHEPSRDSPYCRLAEAAQFRHSVWGARELFYADLFDTRNTGCSSTLGHARPARPARRRAWARSWWPTTRSTSCCSACPTTTRYSHREGPGGAARRRSPRPTRALARLMDAGGRAGRVPGRARGDRDVRPLARPGRGRHEPVRGARGLARAGARGHGARERRAGRVPGLALGPGVRARPGAPRGAGRRAWPRTWRAWPGWTWWRGSRAGGRWSGPRAASCASRRAET